MPSNKCLSGGEKNSLKEYSKMSIQKNKICNAQHPIKIHKTCKETNLTYDQEKNQSNDKDNGN